MDVEAEDATTDVQLSKSPVLENTSMLRTISRLNAALHFFEVNLANTFVSTLHEIVCGLCLVCIKTRIHTFRSHLRAWSFDICDICDV